MPDNETPYGDAAEQEQPLEDDTADREQGNPEVSMEASEADAVEQQTPVNATGSRGGGGNHWDADEGDLAESAREVSFDEEDYR